MPDPRPPQRSERQDETAELGLRDGPESTAAGGPGVFAAGSTIADRYRIESFIARGGMGEVYRAHDLELDAPIALKTLRPSIASDPPSLRQFKREVLLARSVSHPNVCRIYDLGRDPALDVSFLTMEYLPGESLRSRIKRTGRLGGSEALGLVRQLADALDAAHLASVVHRDFKTSNVMLVPAAGGDRAVITDFGLAVHSGAGPGSDDPNLEAFIGTPAYMSPEQVTGGVIGPASDLYSLGIVLYEMATGHVPFDGENPVATALARLSSEPTPPSSYAPIEPTWERAILRLLALDPRARFPNARDLVRALEGRAHVTQGAKISLPAERDAFVGRERDLLRMTTALARDATEAGRSPQAAARLLTLRGPGGTGKTRLAQRFGWDHASGWPGGVWFCDLSDARDVDGMLQAVATSLDVLLGDQDGVVQIGHALAARGQCLVILDNFEQLAEHAEATLGKWLQRATEASFLVTSREALRLRGEQVVDLEPLEPATQGARLFELRAREQRPGFVLDDTNLALVQEIVTLVDGLPLAIELAAARLRMLSLEQLRNRLGDRLGTLVGGKRGRHETLRSTLDWSWDLLDESERSALEQVSVFESGFTLEAAEAVLLLAPPNEPPPVLDVIQSLVDKSWLRARPALGAPRFELLSTVKEYASARSAERSGDPASPRARSRPEVETRHGRYFAGRFPHEEVAVRFRRTGLAEVPEICAEADNLNAACRRAVERADMETAVATFEICRELAELRGPARACALLGEEVLQLCHDPFLRSRLLTSLSRVEAIVGRMDTARAQLEEALATSRTEGERRREGIVLGYLAGIAREAGRSSDARALYDAALDICREVGDHEHEGTLLRNLAILCRQQGRSDEARGYVERSLSRFREFNSRRGEALALDGLATIHLEQGRSQEAADLLEEALAIQREIGDGRSVTTALRHLAITERERGRSDLARKHLEEALSIARPIGDRTIEGWLMASLANLEADAGDLGKAMQHHASALEIAREQQDGRSEARVRFHLATIRLQQGHVESARAELEDVLELFREIGDRRFQGSTLNNLGIALGASGRFEDAREHLEAALAVAREIGDPGNESVALESLGSLEADAGHPGVAQELFERSLSLSRQIGDREGEGSLLVRLGDLDRRAARLDEAESRLTAGLELLRAEGNRFDVARALCYRGLCEHARGQNEAAGRSLEEAESMARPLGLTDRAELARALSSLRRARSGDGTPSPS